MQGWALTRQNLDLGLPQPMRWLVLEYVVRPSLHRSLTCQVLPPTTAVYGWPLLPKEGVRIGAT